MNRMDVMALELFARTYMAIASTERSTDLKKGSDLIPNICKPDVTSRALH